MCLCTAFYEWNKAILVESYMDSSLDRSPDNTWSGPWQYFSFYLYSQVHTLISSLIYQNAKKMFLPWAVNEKNFEFLSYLYRLKWKKNLKFYKIYMELPTDTGATAY